MTEKTGQTPRNIPDHVEDVPNGMIDTSKILSDDELAEGGVVPVQAFMRTKASKNALRKRRQAQRAEEGADGRPPRKQLNIQAPADDASRDALKRVAELMVTGDLSPSDLDVMGRLDTMRLGIDTQRVIMAGGWKAAILRRLIRSGS